MRVEPVWGVCELFARRWRIASRSRRCVARRRSAHSSRLVAFALVFCSDGKRRMPLAGLLAQRVAAAAAQRNSLWPALCAASGEPASRCFEPSVCGCRLKESFGLSTSIIAAPMRTRQISRAARHSQTRFSNFSGPLLPARMARSTRVGWFLHGWRAMYPKAEDA